MEEKKKWKFPVGTVREWETGMVIKSHDNGPMDSIVSPWMNYPKIPKEFLDLFRDCDSLGRRISRFKEPVEGALWLDKEFDQFETKSGKRFTTEEFQSYYEGQYSFHSAFSKRYLGDLLAFNHQLAEEVEKANNTKIDDLRNSGESAKGIVLTPEEVKEIKDKLRLDFKYDDSQKLVIEDVREIHNKLLEVLGYLEKGEDFEGEEKEVYIRATSFLKRIQSGPYTNIIELKQEIRDMLALMNTTFKNNWGIRESYRKKLLSAQNEYISKYRSNIEEDELESFERLLKSDLYGPTKEFYEALRKSSLFEPVNVEDPKYIGQIIQSPSSSDSKYNDYILDKVSLNSVESDNDGNESNYFDVWYTDTLTGKQKLKVGVKESDLQNSIRARSNNSSSLDVPMKLRFNKLYDKELDGEWTENDLTLLETFEKIIKHLPQGHVLTNNYLSKISKEQYLSDSDNGYAHYNSTKREIFLSSDCLSKQQVGITDLDNGNEIASTLIHEVGHAISTKLRRRASMPYRKFVVECGWTWEQFQFEDEKSGKFKHNNFIATGNDPDIKRYGSKSDVPLITQYAAKSPEEAFAEYYSVYTQYKSRIDSFLAGNDKALEKDVAPNLQKTNWKFSEFLKENRRSGLSPKQLQDIESTRSSIDSLLHTHNRDQSHFKSDIVDPYYDNLETLNEDRVNKNKIITEKSPTSNYSTNFKYPEPVFTVFDTHTGKHDIINSDETRDPQVHYANKYLRRMSPTFSISKECFKLLQQKGYSISQIRDYTLSRMGDEPVPQVKRTKEGTATSFSGLKYRSEVIPASKLVKMHGIFTAMKKIWESEELKKALEELGFSHQLQESSLNSQEIDTSTIQQLISKAKNSINQILRKSKGVKQQYADTIIRNSEGQILLQQRSYQDDFMPGKWGLPGGKVEEDESILVAAQRELEEETGLRLSLIPVQTVEKDDCTIHYFEHVLQQPISIVLDNVEHYRYQFVDFRDLDKYDLILDLHEILNSLPLSLIEVDKLQQNDLGPEFLDDLLEKRMLARKDFDEERISEEEYLKRINHIKDETFNYVRKSFDKGLIDESTYQRLHQAYIGRI